MHLKSKNILHKSFISTLIICLFLCLNLEATDAEAQVEFEKAKTAYSKQKFRDAGDYFLAAKLYADSPDLKKQALEKAADAFGKAGQKYKQFKCLRDLVAGFSDQIDFESVINKEFEIGNDFARGHRDISLSWMPWIKGENKSIEVFEAVLEQAPFAKFAPALKLRLGRMYLEDGKIEKSLQIFRQIIKQHPKSPEDKFARFELANALVQMAGKAGDGDGRYAREAEEVLKEALKKYPKDPETQWIKQSILDTDEVRAKRLYDIGTFYVSRKNPEAATRYFHELLARYPESTYADNTEKELGKLDENFKPSETKKKKYKNPYPITELQDEPKIILIAPQASGGKWLLPLEDLDLDGSHAEAEYQAKATATKEAQEKARKEREKRVAAEREKRKKAEAEMKAKKEAELKKKAEEEKIALEKAEKEKAEAEKLEKETLEKARAEKEEQERKDQKAKAAAAEAKRQTEEAEKKKAAEEKAKQKTEKPKTPIEKIKFKPGLKKDSGSGSIYLIPLILLVLLVIAGIIYFWKKKKGAE